MSDLKKILVVDESALIRMKCYRLLVDNGYEVVEAKKRG